MGLQVHRWFRYSAGFSAEWAEGAIGRALPGEGLCVLDPFAGVGTTLLAAEARGTKGTGFEAHPFVFRVARAKLGWNVPVSALHESYQELLRRARKRPAERAQPPSLMQKCFTEESLERLGRLKRVFLEDYNDGTSLGELLWLGITAIVRSCSVAGTAQWQYVLPNKQKANVYDPFDAFVWKMEAFALDIEAVKRAGWTESSAILQHDARVPCEHVEQVDMVITSPPYPNNYDYADATRLEMTFWGEVEGWGDLQAAARQYLVRSCSQHSAAEKLQLDELLRDPVIAAIRGELTRSCRALETLRLVRAGKKTYHTMAAAYFVDMARTLRALRTLCKSGGKMCFVVGDSAPYGVHLAVERWLGELAVDAGFGAYSFEKIRDRNTKWKNRKHRVPLQEGRLWIEG
ncbi:MAG: DNA modification methylase [Phycisphaerae bacterium]|nr:DNA modification methylase [Phycisphaerae bacterium]